MAIKDVPGSALSGKAGVPAGRWMSGKQMERLKSALLSGFPTVESLEQMLKFGLDLRLQDITNANGLDAQVFALLTDAEAVGYLDRLVAAAKEARPENPLLKAYVHERGPVPYSI